MKSMIHSIEENLKSGSKVMIIFLLREKHFARACGR